jgi:hypothetical protein
MTGQEVEDSLRRQIAVRDECWHRLWELCKGCGMQLDPEKSQWENVEQFIRSRRTWKSIFKKWVWHG